MNVLLHINWHINFGQFIFINQKGKLCQGIFPVEANIFCEIIFDCMLEHWWEILMKFLFATLINMKFPAVLIHIWHSITYFQWRVEVVPNHEQPKRHRESGGSQCRGYPPWDVQGNTQENPRHQAVPIDGATGQLRPHPQRIFLRSTSWRVCTSFKLLQVNISLENSFKSFLYFFIEFIEFLTQFIWNFVWNVCETHGAIIYFLSPM